MNLHTSEIILMAQECGYTMVRYASSDIDMLVRTDGLTYLEYILLGSDNLARYVKFPVETPKEGDEFWTWRVTTVDGKARSLRICVSDSFTSSDQKEITSRLCAAQHIRTIDFVATPGGEIWNRNEL